MARPSSIDRLPDEIREQIGALRRQGRTIDEIMAALASLLPEHQQPSRSGVGRYVKRMDVLTERIRMSDEISDRIVGRFGEDSEDKQLRLLSRMLGENVFATLMAVEDGEGLDPKDVKALSETLRNIAATRKIDAETILKAREEAEKKMRVAAVQAAETVGKERGLSTDTIQAIRAQILGVKA